MEELIINKYMAKVIENALRLTANLNNCRTEETAYDREVMLATKYIKDVLGKTNEFNAGKWWNKLSLPEQKLAWVNEYADTRTFNPNCVGVDEITEIYMRLNPDKTK